MPTHSSTNEHSQPSLHTHAIQRLHAVTDAQIRGLAEVLIDCVSDGASVSFMHPLPVSKAMDYWRRVGIIPGYALLPQGGLCDTTVFYRLL
jgi:hypothetical protein